MFSRITTAIDSLRNSVPSTSRPEGAVATGAADVACEGVPLRHVVPGNDACTLVPAFRCAYDDATILPGAATASRGPNGETISAWRRGQAIVDALTAKYGPWHRDPKIDIALRVGYGKALAEALVAMPVVLARPLEGLRYVIIHRAAAVGLGDDGTIGVYTHRQRVANAAWRLSACRDSAFHWDRPARAIPCADAQAAKLLRPALISLHSTLRNPINALEHPLAGVLTSLSKMKLRVAPRGMALSDPTVAASLVAHGIESDCAQMQDLPPAVFAAATILYRLQGVGQLGFGLAILRLFQAPLLREAWRCGHPSAYFWLGARDADAERPAIASRRRQFAKAYPELIVPLIASQYPGDIVTSTDPQIRAKLEALAQAVDDARPVTPLIHALRGWPPWVEKTLRGRLTARSRLAFVLYRQKYAPDSLIGDEIAALLAALGPAWKPRRGDETIVAFLALLANSIGAEARSIARVCPVPGKGPSPWKQVWRHIAPSTRPNREGKQSPRIALWDYDQIATAIRDTVAAFEIDIVLPLLGTSSRSRTRDLNPFHYYDPSYDASLTESPLRSLSLAALLRVADQYHQRLDVIRRAKQHAALPQLEKRLRWPSLFAPFSLRDSRLEIRCLTDAEQLQAHAVELNHCADRYAVDCTAGECHIVGFFSAGRAIATAELKADENQRWLTVQFAGYRNGKPPAMALAALKLLMRELTPESQAQRETRGRRSASRIGLYVAPPSDLEGDLAARRRLVRRYQMALAVRYDIDDPEALHRVLAAWRFAMPDGMRAAWERGASAAESVENVRSWLTALRPREQLAHDACGSMVKAAQVSQAK